ncbi:MAG: universal stress protein [Bryobacterales bacterium]|nr:universal stress protein [Bryobacterales bacterium]MBV9399623.1 universal stress protein [Bryobacterales bacterium]
MLEFRHILFPVDFSEQGDAFRPLVQFVARHFQARLTLLHAVPILTGADYGDIAGMFAAAVDYTAIEERMGTLLRDFFPLQEEEGIPECTRKVSLGDPAVVIADYAANNKVDLIMMPTHGYGRFRSLLIGSVVSKVLHDAECPVWTSAHADVPVEAAPVSVRSILAALDLAEGQKEIICGATDLAAKFNATVKLVHAVPAAEHVPGDTGGDEFGNFLVRSAREHLENLQAGAGTDFELLVEPGPVAQTIRKVALETKADLVVVGRGLMQAAFGRLRSREYEIIRESPCPVLSL